MKHILKWRGRRNSPLKHILVVEPNRHIRRLIQVHLERAVFMVSMANDGEQALQRLGCDPAIDLIIMEIMMSVMDGFALIRKIRQQPVLASVPILVLGGVRNEVSPDDPPGLTMEDIEQQARQWYINYGANEFLVTPFHPAELVKKVLAMLSGR